MVAPEISGTTDDPTALVSVNINGQTYGAFNNGDGTWTLAAGTIVSLTAGQTYPINVDFTDDAGNSTTAESTINIVRLDADMPVVNTFTSSTGKDVVLTGTFDSVNSTGFKVEVKGVVYTLGASRALSANANNWTLDLTNLSFKNGPYGVVATSLTRGGNDVIDQTNNELNIAIPASISSSQSSVVTSSSQSISSLSSSLTSYQNRGTIVQTGVNSRPFVVGLFVLLVLVGSKMLRSENK